MELMRKALRTMRVSHAHRCIGATARKGIRVLIDGQIACDLGDVLRMCASLWSTAWQFGQVGLKVKLLMMLLL